MGITVFYNGCGHPDFFRRNIPHISYSETLGLTKKIKKENGIDILMVLTDALYVITQEFQVVEKFTKGITVNIIPLESLE
jgi:hypothetical protein